MQLLFVRCHDIFLGIAISWLVFLFLNASQAFRTLRDLMWNMSYVLLVVDDA